MDRNRESRRAGSSLPAAPNGLARRRHRSSSLRDSPEDDGLELPEPARLRDRGIKKDRERDRDRERERERDKERERERSRSSKRRRADRMMNAGDDSSEEDESVNDEEDDDEDVDAGQFSRMLPPLPNPISSGPHPPPSISTNNSHHHHLHRKSFPPATAAKVFKVATAPSWKAADEMIGVSVPRKARTASTKRSHDWISGSGGEQMNHRQASTSPVRQGGLISSTSSPAALRDAPLSPPSSSNASIKKKIKPSGGAKPRPQPRSTTTSKSSSSNNNPEELEIEIAEVLYGLMTQSQAPSKNDSTKLELNNKSNSDAKSRASSPPSNSSSAAPLSAVAPTRKKPRQVAENNLAGSSSLRSSPAMKVEIDQTPRSEICSSNLEKNLGSAAESASITKSVAESNQHHLKSTKLESSILSESKGALIEEASESRDVVSTTKEELNTQQKDSPMVKLNEDSKELTVTSMATSTNMITAPAHVNKREEKFQIDLMAPPPQLRSSPERDGAVDSVGDGNRMEKRVDMSKDKETGKVGMISKEETVTRYSEKNAKAIYEEVELQKSFGSKERNIDLRFDLEKPGSDTINKSQNDKVVKSQVQLSSAVMKEEQPNTDTSAQSISLPLPMSVASWPGGISPPIGYMAPLQGVVSMEGGTMPSAPQQPLFSQPRPKRCATHCHIARNIHYYQQVMKMNPFWTSAAGTASMFGAKPSNINVIPPAELHGNVAGRSLNPVQDKGHSLAIFPGNAGKEKLPQSANIPDTAHRKQQLMLQQAMAPVPPNNLLHAPAFIFPFNQQQGTVVGSSGRPGSAKSPTTGSLPSTGESSSATVTASTPAQGPGSAPASALGFNYPNMSANETQYLVLQNSPYPFPIPAVGAPPNFRGHAQPMPMFNGSFYPSQMIHPLQLQQQQPPASQQQQIQQTHQNTSASSATSQKHLTSQQHRPQGNTINGGGSGSGVLHNFPAPKSRTSQHQNQHITPPQARQLESEVGREDTPSNTENRGSRAPVNIYNQNFAMPIHSQNFALMGSPATPASSMAASSCGNQNDKKQQHQQHQGFKSGVESLPSQAFAMSFGPMIGSTSASGIDLSSMSQNHAILQSLPEATRQSYQQIMHAAANAQVAQQKKNSRMPEDGKIGGTVSSNADEERKVLTGKAAASGGQSISFGRPDFADVSASGSPGNNVIDSSARTLNLASGPTRMPNVLNSVGPSNSHLHAQLQQQQQQLIQMHNQQQQHLAANVTARSKTPATSNGISYSEHLNSSSSVNAKFPGSISGFPPNFVQSSNSPTQSPQWKNSNRTPTSQVQSSLVSSTASLKNHQQQPRTLQSHTQISFGANQKPSASQGQQHPSSSQSPSPPVVVGSPTHSSISKGASSSPRTNTASTNKSSQASALSSQQAKNPTSVPSQKSSPAGGRNVPSVLGNPHNAVSSGSATKTIQLQQQHHQQQQQLQQQLSKQTLQQAMFFSNPYLQGQPPSSTNTNTSAASGYYLQRRRPEQQQSQQPQGSSASSSSTMLSMSPPVTQSSTSTTDPAKAAAAAAAAASNMKGGGLSSQGILHSPQFSVQSGNSHQLLPVGFSYGHSIPAAPQVKPAEQKQPAGNDNLHTCWQPDKK